jgi:sulfatase maturation enzyme AslB (radical SAM superfamily)
LEGTTEAVFWELSYLRQNVDPVKVYIVSVPDSRSRKLTKFSRVLGYTPGKKFEWEKFRSRLLASGYTIPQDDPGSGYVMAFDKSWQAIVACAQAKSSKDYVETIKKYLGQPGLMYKCRYCGRRVLPEPNGHCPICQQKWIHEIV